MMDNPAKQVSPDEIREVTERLLRAYPYIFAQKQQEGVFGEPPLDSLIRAILSQHTTDLNRDRAFAALRSRYPRWEDAADAPAGELAMTMRQTNYAPTKAARVQQVLRRLREEHGHATLDFLRGWPAEDVLAYLRQFPGVGEKSAAIVSLFSLGLPIIPVDVHVHRVTQRLGWIGAKVTPERAHALLQQLVPPDIILPLHIGMWEHGHTTCRPLPRCAQCAIYEFCLYPDKTASPPRVKDAIAMTAAQSEAK